MAHCRPLQVRDYAEHNDAVLLLVIPATQAANILGARALKLVQDLDGEGTLDVLRVCSRFHD